MKVTRRAGKHARPRERRVPHGRAHFEQRIARRLSAIVVVASSAVAFAVAGGLAIASAAVATFTPLRDYAVREPAADEVVNATTGDESVAVTGE